MSGGYAAAHAGLADVIAAAVDAADPESYFGRVTVLRRPGKLGTPPVVYVPPPSLTWDAAVAAPTEAVFELVAAVKADEDAIERLFELLDPLSEAIFDAGRTGGLDAVIVSCEPAVWTTGGTELPAYFVRTEVAV